MLLTGFAGAFRRSELCALVASDIALKPDAMVIRIRKSKTDQTGKGQYKTIAANGNPYCPVAAMRAWLKAAHIKDGCVFVQIERTKGGTVVSDRCVDGRAVARVVQSLAAKAGLNAAQFGGHSLRSGFITSAAERKHSKAEIASISGHALTSNVLEGYIQMNDSKALAVSRDVLSGLK